MQIKDLIKEYSILMQKISEVKFAGVLPLDSILHIIIGYILYVSLKKIFKANSAVALFFVFLLEVIKEVIDSFSLTNTLNENISDVAATMTIPIILFVIEKTKDKKKLN